MKNKSRLARFILLVGITLIVLSFAGPFVEPSYDTYFGINHGYYRGYAVKCVSDIDIHIISREAEPFSAYFMDYENGLSAFEDQSLKNATVMYEFINRTSTTAHISIPATGWYIVLITPASNESISFMTIEIKRPTPNQGPLASGVLLVAFGFLVYIDIKKLIANNLRR
ncbi:hypothetical protein EU537_06065 [Candidatus Thorarchaeota archaeon]|nr:MAG: hypothetical protein EU537_06065 [Candidatus Thorarchaeota archaeon]